MNKVIFACQNPSEAHWQVGHLPVEKYFLTIIGWRVIPQPIDAGVPKKIAEVLARAMTSVARITFPSSDIKHNISDSRSSINGDFAISIKENFIDRIINTFSHAPSIALLSTRKPETALLMFDDSWFHWNMQGQIALLSESDGNLPEIDKQTLFGLFEDTWVESATDFQDIGIKGIMRPGVDGDLAAFLSLTKEFEKNLLTAMENETRAAGFDWAIVSEDEF